MFDFSKKCTVLVLDRSGDAVTPLLTPWTYEAMLHELIPGGIVDNTVAVRAEPGVVRPSPPMPSLLVSRTVSRFICSIVGLQGTLYLHACEKQWLVHIMVCGTHSLLSGRSSERRVCCSLPVVKTSLNKYNLAS